MSLFVVGCSCTKNKTPDEKSIIEKIIGSKGGMVGDVESSIALNIPKGALYKDKEDEISETPLMNFLGATEFGPSGTVFKEPVEVSMKLTKVPNGSEISVFVMTKKTKFGIM